MEAVGHYPAGQRVSAVRSCFSVLVSLGTPRPGICASVVGGPTRADLHSVVTVTADEMSCIEA